MSRYYYKFLQSIVGRLKLIASDESLVAILWENEKTSPVPLDAMTEDSRHPILLQTEHQLAEYFNGKRRAFSIRLAPKGTAFQTKVWAALATIPFGETRSYSQIARQIGNPRAMRAVGAANGQNPIPIIVPCHRVIGASGNLTGFAGGLANKERLLALENQGKTGSKSGPKQILLLAEMPVSA